MTHVRLTSLEVLCLTPLANAATATAGKRKDMKPKRHKMSTDRGRTTKIHAHHVWHALIILRKEHQQSPPRTNEPSSLTVPDDINISENMVSELRRERRASCAGHGGGHFGCRAGRRFDTLFAIRGACFVSGLPNSP